MATNNRPDLNGRMMTDVMQPTAGSLSLQSTARSDAGEGNKGSADRRRFFQVKNRYIMCPVISGIMMIDERRAHERVLYERYLASLSDGPKPAQVSLLPRDRA